MQPYLPYIIPAVATVVVAIITSLTTICGVYLKERYFPKKKQQTLSTIKSNCYIELDKICASIRDIVKANLVYIAYFHNGGHFINGVAMDKYTVVGEDYDVTCKSIKKSLRDILVNNFPYLFHDLLVRNKHVVSSTEKQPMYDKSYKEDLEERGMKSAYTFLIKDPVKDIPLGFISIEYNKDDGFAESDDKYIWKKHNTIAKLLNMNS